MTDGTGVEPAGAVVAVGGRTAPLGVRVGVGVAAGVGWHATSTGASSAAAHSTASRDRSMDTPLQSRCQASEQRRIIPGLTRDGRQTAYTPGDRRACSA